LITEITMLNEMQEMVSAADKAAIEARRQDFKEIYNNLHSEVDSLREHGLTQLTNLDDEEKRLYNKWLEVCLKRRSALEAAMKEDNGDSASPVVAPQFETVRGQQNTQRSTRLLKYAQQRTSGDDSSEDRTEVGVARCCVIL